MTMRQAIRKYCLWCCDGQSNEVELCIDKTCSLWGYRLNKRIKDYPYKLTSLKAIKIKCKDCQLENRNDVKNCGYSNCHLYPFRLGKNPNRKGVGGSPKIYQQLKKSLDLRG